MDRIFEIQKPAFIARVNDLARARLVVDTYYKHEPDGHCMLMLVYNDGSEKPFKGLRAA